MKTDPNCGEIVVVQGWFIQSTDKFSLLRSDATLTDCDAVHLRTSTPLILITAGTRRFVVVREHGYEDESFAVIEIRGNHLEKVLEVAGGGC